MDPPDQEALVLLKTIKGGCQQAGREERII
jgi:hypothetical protein